MHCVVGPRGFLGSALRRHLDHLGIRHHAFTRSDRWSAEEGEPCQALADSEVIYWLAGSVNPATADARTDLITADTTALRSFADAVHRSDVQRVVFASSGGTVYDVSASPPYDEGAATLPLSRYGRYKLHHEQLLSQLLPADVELVVLRIGNAYGPGQPVGTGQGVVAYWLEAAANGRPLLLFGTPSTTRDFTYIDDVAAALAHFSQIPMASSREFFNIASGTPTTLGDLAATIMHVVADPGLRLETMPARPFDVPHFWLDVTRATNAGWRPTVPLATGIERSWNALPTARLAI
jgi:UDP-glucose 4-epimerase